MTEEEGRCCGPWTRIVDDTVVSSHREIRRFATSKDAAEVRAMNFAWGCNRAKHILSSTRTNKLLVGKFGKLHDHDLCCYANSKVDAGPLLWGLPDNDDKVVGPT